MKPEGINPKSKRPFKFEQMWLCDKGCSSTVNKAWGPPLIGAIMVEVAGKVQFCGEKLTEWSKNSFGNVKKTLEEKINLLSKIEMDAARGGDPLRVKALQLEINNMLDKENLMWQQRSRALFLKSGDRNTAYFHSKASQRFRRNWILGLKNTQNEWCTEESQIKNIAVDYYQALFSSSSPSKLEKILNKVQPSVTEPMNLTLLKDFSREEVELALSQMEPIIAPGPDGMPPIFYQSFWPSIGDDVCSAVLDCLHNCRIPNEINHTHIALIPKVKSHERITEFRPISLCSVIYKVVSKVLANRLKGILPSVVSENQSAFQAGRLITDNILMAFETLHYMKHHQKGKTGFMAMKLDMSKAYDRVEWKYLEQIMIRMGFAEKWVALMMECISTVSYSIIINGDPSPTIHPTRGIRQGDPLSPYLFLFCTEGLHSLLQHSADFGQIRGVSICKLGPRLTHLFFANDSLLFCRSTISECQKIQESLDFYEKASGQQLNRAKSSLLFSKSTFSLAIEQITNYLGAKEVKNYEKYLGLPSLIGKNKRASLMYIKERVWSKLQGWKEQLLS